MDIPVMKKKASLGQKQRMVFCHVRKLKLMNYTAEIEVEKSALVAAKYGARGKTAKYGARGKPDHQMCYAFILSAQTLRVYLLHSVARCKLALDMVVIRK